MKDVDQNESTKQYVFDLATVEGAKSRARVAADTIDEALDWVWGRWKDIHMAELSCVTWGWCGEWHDNTEFTS